jgi:hypothetical protein
LYEPEPPPIISDHGERGRFSAPSAGFDAGQVEQPVVASTIQQQSPATDLREPWSALTVDASVEQPVVARTIQQQSSSTLVCAVIAFDTVTSSVEQPVVASTIQQQLSDGAATAATLSVVQPVVATIIQQQFFEVIGLLPFVRLVNCPHETNLTHNRPLHGLLRRPPQNAGDFGNPSQQKQSAECTLGNTPTKHDYNSEWISHS